MKESCVFCYYHININHSNMLVNSHCSIKPISESVVIMELSQKGENLVKTKSRQVKRFDV